VIEGNDIKQNGVTNPEKGSFCTIVAGVGAGVGADSGTGLAILYANNVQVIGNTIEGNIVTSVSSTFACAAGVLVEGSSEVILKNNIIRNNQAGCNPGFEALEAPASKLLLIQNLIYGNTAPNDTVQVFVSGTSQAAKGEAVLQKGIRKASERPTGRWCVSKVEHSAGRAPTGSAEVSSSTIRFAERSLPPKVQTFQEPSMTCER
jgi:hypothetical protein